MAHSAAGEIAERISTINLQLLKATKEVAPDDLARSPGPTSPSIAFHLWHIARWSDRVQATLPGMAPALTDRIGIREEIWVSERLAREWGLDGAPLGRAETGLGMADDDAIGMALPSKEVLLSYAERTFAAVEQAAEGVSDDLLGVVGPDSNGRDAAIGTALLSHLTHASRHLGMIEALRGLRGERGTASA